MGYKITSLQFKRGNKADLTSVLVGESRPFKGEPIWEIDTNRLKIGDGITDYGNLPYATGEAEDLGLVILGYYQDNAVYREESHQNKYPYYESKLYLDLPSGRIYFFVAPEGRFRQLVQEAQVDSNLPGLVKLYGTTGQNEDGTMTQKAITAYLSKKVEMSLEKDNETLVLRDGEN